MDDMDAFSISQFCKRHGISPSFYFAEAREGRMPRVMRIGHRVLISKEAAPIGAESASKLLKNRGGHVIDGLENNGAARAGVPRRLRIALLRG